MARMIEKLIAVKITKIVKDADGDSEVTTESKINELSDAMIQIAEGVLGDPSIVVEVMELE